jgi:hypothetical protein
LWQIKEKKVGAAGSIPNWEFHTRCFRKVPWSTRQAKMFRQPARPTRIHDVFEAFDPATETLGRIAMRLIFKSMVFVRIGVFYCLCG